MVSVLFHVPSSLPVWWVWLSMALLIAAIPAIQWIVREPRRRMMAAVFTGVVLVAAVASGQVQCPQCFEGCCPDFVPYGICWPIGWWPC